MPRTLVGALMLSLFVSSARDALAQSDKKLEVRAFAPPEYRVELRVDVGRLVESGVWDLAERSFVVKPLLAAFRDTHGFDLTDVEVLTMVQSRGANEDFEAGPPLVVLGMVGNERVSLAKFRLEQEWGPAGERTELAGVPAIVRSDEAWLELRPGVVVTTQRDHAEHAARGEVPGAGVPHPDLMALTAGLHSDLAYLGGLFESPFDPNDVRPFPAEWFTGDDELRALRLRFGPADEEGELEVELLLRFDSGAAGPARFEKGFRDWRSTAAKQERMVRPFAALLEAVTLEADGRDLTLRLALGAPEKAAATLMQFATLLIPVVTLAEPAAVEVAPVAPPAPAAPPAPRRDGK